MLRMWSVLSHMTSILLMAGAAYRKVTLLLGMMGTRHRKEEADRHLDPWTSVVSITEYWRRKPREVPTYKQPTLMSSVSTCSINNLLQSSPFKKFLPFLQVLVEPACSTVTLSRIASNYSWFRFKESILEQQQNSDPEVLRIVCAYLFLKRYLILCNQFSRMDEHFCTVFTSNLYHIKSSHAFKICVYILGYTTSVS